MTDPLQFLFAVVLLLAVPGPTNTVMATAGAVNRGEGPWRFMAAELAGYLAIVALARLVLLPLIDAWPVAGIALKLLVVAYLLYAALRLWRTPIALDERRRISPWLVATTTLLNPKGLIFALSVIPRAHQALWAYFVAFAILVLAIGCAWFLGGRTLAIVSGERAGLLPRVGAVALTGFAAYLAWSLAAG